MKDVNGQEIRVRDLVQILCEVREISKDGVLVRILNSDQELLVSAAADEVLGGDDLVASSELSKFSGSPAALEEYSEAEASISERLGEQLEKAFERAWPTG